MSFLKNPRVATVLGVILRLLLGAVFIASGLQKLNHLEFFYQTAQGYRILTPALTQLYAGWLPWLELLAGTCLLLGLFIRHAAALSSLLLVSFMIAITWVLLRGDVVECGCFVGGSQSAPVTWGLWFRDLLMLAGTLLLAITKPRAWSLDARIEKTGWKKALLALVIVYGVVTGFRALNSEIPPKPEPPPEAMTLSLLPVGSMAPDFSLVDLDGKTVSLRDFRHKKSVLIELFATWCPHCQHSVPVLNGLQQRYGKHVQILAINAGDKPDQPSTGAAFRRDFHVTYPILERPGPELQDAYRLTAFPTFYLVDETGKIVWVHVSTLNEPAYRQLQSILEAMYGSPRL